MMKHEKRLGSFQKKISASFVLLTAVLVAVTLSQVYTAQTGERLSFETTQLRGSFDRVAKGTNDCANNVIMQLNSDRRISLQALASGEPQGRTTTDFVLNVGVNSLRLATDISSINILFKSGMLCCVEHNLPTYVLQASPALQEETFALPVTTQGGFYHLKNAGGEDQTLYFCKELRDASVNAAVGVIFLELRQDTLREYCVSAQDSSIVLTDSSGAVLASTGKLNPGTEFSVAESSGRMKAQGTTWLYRSENVSRSGWRVISLLDESVAMASIRTTALVLVALVLLAILAAITMVVARRLCRPVRELSEHMASSAGQMPLPLSVPTQTDEITTLYDSFNGMLEQNRRLFADFKAEQKQKNRTELAFMQSQIKPHFLYNTLDTIYCLAGMDRAQEAGDVTKALADYYRLVLNHGEDKITIERELAALQQYLVIMQVRYRDMLQYTIGCEDEVKNVIVPKLLLQPLVENAIYHGIKPKKQPGTVRIYAARNGDAVELTVTDDGIGMTEERFQKALAGVRHEDSSETFGMHNVVRRLQLFYGERSHLELRTGEGLTTVAAVIYPEEARDV